MIFFKTQKVNPLASKKNHIDSAVSGSQSLSIFVLVMFDLPFWKGRHHENFQEPCREFPKSLVTEPCGEFSKSLISVENVQEPCITFFFFF